MTPADNQTFAVGNDLVNVLMDLLDVEVLWEIMAWTLDWYERTGKPAYLVDLKQEHPRWHEQVTRTVLADGSGR